MIIIIFATYDLCGLGNYEDLTKPLRNSYQNSLVLRKAVEKLDNQKLDTMVRNLKGYLGDKVFSITSFDPLKVASYIMRPFVKSR